MSCCRGTGGRNAIGRDEVDAPDVEADAGGGADAVEVVFGRDDMPVAEIIS